MGVPCRSLSVPRRAPRTMRSVRLARASSAQPFPWTSWTWAARPTSPSRASSIKTWIVWMRTAGFAMRSVPPPRPPPGRDGEQDDLRVGRLSQPETLLRPGDQHRAALGVADAALQLAACALQAGVALARLGEGARGAQPVGLAPDDERQRGERGQPPEAEPVPH